MKKQTNDKYDKEEIIMGAIGKDALKLVRDIGFKQGYAKALDDVEKIIDDKCDDINSSLSIEFCKDERDINEKNARFGELKELKQEIARLKGETKWLYQKNITKRIWKLN